MEKLTIDKEGITGLAGALLEVADGNGTVFEQHPYIFVAYRQHEAERFRKGLMSDGKYRWAQDVPVKNYQEAGYLANYARLLPRGEQHIDLKASMPYREAFNHPRLASVASPPTAS